MIGSADDEDVNYCKWIDFIIVLLGPISQQKWGLNQQGYNQQPQLHHQVETVGFYNLPHLLSPS